MNISPPVLIMSGIVGLFVLVFIIFLIVSKKSDKQEKEKSLEQIQALEIEMRQMSPGDFKEEPKIETAPDVSPPPDESPSPPPEPADKDLSPADDVKKADAEDDGRVEEAPMEIISGSAAAVDLETRPGVDASEPVSSRGETDSRSIFAEDEKSDGDFVFDSSSELKDVGVADLWGSEDDDEASPSTAGIFDDTADEGQSPADIFGDGPDEGTEDASPDDIFGSGDAFDGAVAVSDDLFEEEEVADEDIIARDDDIENLVKQVSPISVESEPKKPAAPPSEPEPMDPEEQKRHDKARRIARVIINDIRNYNPDKLAEGIRGGNIMKTLGVEIERGRQLYIKRVPQDIAKTTNYYKEALIKLLGDGNTKLFGW